MREYAFGDDVYDGCECPVTTAGFDTIEPAMSKVAGKFDDIIFDSEQYRGIDKGTVSESEAKTAWAHVISYYKRYPPTHDKRMFYDAAVEVAEEMGWDDIV